MKDLHEAIFIEYNAGRCSGNISRSSVRRMKSLGGILAILCFFLLVPIVSMTHAAQVTQITLAWDPSSDPDVAGYRVYRRTAGKTHLKPIGAVENVANPNFSSKVLCGRKYCFAVTAYDIYGNESPLSDEISWPIQVFSPNGGEIIPSGSSCSIQWYADSRAEEFELLYSVNKGRSWHPIATLTGSFRSYEWTVPEVVKRKTKCKVKVVLKGAGGVTLGSDVNDGYFRISPQ
jgi:hypothetical protein